MLNSERYRQNAAECLSAAMDAQQPDYRDLHLGLARSWISLAREDEAVATLLAIWRVADSLPGTNVLPFSKYSRTRTISAIVRSLPFTAAAIAGARDSN
jgi:hypothetical protein